MVIYKQTGRLLTVIVSEVDDLARSSAVSTFISSLSSLA